MPGMTEILKRGRVSAHEKVKNGPSMLIMAPTRELCQQIHQEAEKFGRPAGIHSCAIYGGASKGPQIGDLMRGQDIVVATPGRLLDFLTMTDYKTGNLVAKLDRTFLLVLDEADRMLDMGFEDDIKKIIGKMRCADRQSLFFTATWPKEVERCAYSILKNPVEIRIGNPDALIANKDIKQDIVIVESGEKLSLLREHVHKLAPKQRLLIFTNTKVMCQEICRQLYREGIQISAIHGDLDQFQRDQILNRFRMGRDPVLVATDVAARGLDISDVNVLNYDFPSQCEDYIHRIGRSGRAGATGHATTFFTRDDAKSAQGLIQILKEAKQRIDDQLYDLYDEYRMTKGGKRGPKRSKFMRFDSRGFRKESRPNSNYQNKSNYHGGSRGEPQNGGMGGFRNYDNKYQGS